VHPLTQRLRDDARLVARSLAAAPVRWTVLVVGTGAIGVLATLIGHAIGGDPGYLFTEFRVEGRYAGTMTAVSAFFLGAAGMALLIVSALLRQAPGTRRFAIPWAFAAAGLFVLGADDLLMLHEILGYRLDRLGVPRIMGVSYDQYAVVAYGIVTLLLLGRLSESLRLHWSALFPLACALLLFLFAGLVDLTIPVGRLGPTGQAVVGPLDQIAKAVGSVMMYAFANTMLVSVVRWNATVPLDTGHES
jgi:hypothetical protein